MITAVRGPLTHSSRCCCSEATPENSLRIVKINAGSRVSARSDSNCMASPVRPSCRRACSLGDHAGWRSTDSTRTWTARCMPAVIAGQDATGSVIALTHRDGPRVTRRLSSIRPSRMRVESNWTTAGSCSRQSCSELAKASNSPIGRLLAAWVASVNPSKPTRAPALTAANRRARTLVIDDPAERQRRIGPGVEWWPGRSRCLAVRARRFRHLRWCR